MKKRNLSIAFILMLSAAVSGQIKVNQNGKTYFGSGSTTSNNGIISINSEGPTNGISIGGNTGGSFTIFKHGYDGYITKGGSITKV